MKTDRVMKTFLLLLLAGMLGCSPAPKQEEGAGAGDKIVTITVNNGPLEEDKEQQEENGAKLALFHQLHPNIRVVESTWQYTPDSFLTKMAGGTCTDIVGIPMATELKGIVRKGLALELTPLLEKWEGRQYLNPLVMQNYTTPDCKVWALPGGPDLLQRRLHRPDGSEPLRRLRHPLPAAERGLGLLRPGHLHLRPVRCGFL